MITAPNQQQTHPTTKVITSPKRDKKNIETKKIKLGCYRKSRCPKKLSPGETDALLVGFISLSGVLLLLLILLTIGVVCFVCKTRAQTAAFKKDINPVYGADNEAEAAEKNDKRVSNAETYDYMGE